MLLVTKLPSYLELRGKHVCFLSRARARARMCVYISSPRWEGVTRNK